MILQNEFTMVTSQPHVGSVTDSDDCREAAQLVSEGYPVGAFVRSTCGVFVDAASRRAVESIFRIKGAGRTGKPMSVLFGAEVLVPMIDQDKIPASLRQLFQDPGELASRLSTLCFIRVPITPSAAAMLPPVVVSTTADGTHWVQSYLPGERGSGSPFIDSLGLAAEVPAATSMNVSGQVEIVDQQEGLAFCAEHGIPLFLADPGAKVVARGSYPIISVAPEGARLLREGHFPGSLFRYLLQAEVDTSQARPAKFPVYKTHCEKCAGGMTPHELHDEIVTMLGGAEP